MNKDQQQQVVDFALAQVGKPYVFKADGPIAFDCSGLVQKALAQVGVDVPHQSGLQAEFLGAVKALPENKRLLQPGDVVFWYGSTLEPMSISHCGIYVGRRGPLWMCVAAVDEAHGVMKHRMNWALPPSGFGYVRHH